ncbi:5-methyltetrahydropteroyltriglutamate--homocysteine methyltransferase [Saccharothrix sp. NRRL B-16348]|jgi:5-methyltetrahydropteroyltriglutamate--homocysteine methyltransferase|uniref:cobalamin-independent methionine synthase II family protein n=1 Tax=Saccharothrix sp. NRRL B-16348 TaxID=1415542 RepID=UPI0006AD84C9|nr:cobalamin-independent methionine synthase II family protein [Saccharothrix sp. NRRL B-16348]KOX28218.1 5-methyltetrahydropteroyltriglutamate--homocysteine methyltransferase [Saccharothrix sp. NRRL B-16348]
MGIPTEPIGSVPRPAKLLKGFQDHAEGRIDAAALRELTDEALADTVSRFEGTGSPVLTDGEQDKPSFLTYPVAGIPDLAAGGAVVPFADGHTRELPVLTSGPFRYSAHAVDLLRATQQLTALPVKQPVIAPSALALLYPGDGIDGYSRDEFIADLVNETEADIRACLDAGAAVVQLDFTEGRLSLKLDPSGGLLRDFVSLNNAVLERFSEADRARIGLHTCPGGDWDSTHSADVDYADLLPDLFRIKAGRFYVQLASEPDRRRVLEIIKEHLPADAQVFIGVTDPIDPRVETPEEVRDRVLEAAEFIPVDRLGTCDDCGFAPFADDTSTSRDTAFAKIAARVEGTKLAEVALGL